VLCRRYCRFTLFAVSRKSVIENLEKEGWEIIDWDYDEQGMRIVSDK